MNIVYSPDCKGQIVVSYSLYVVAIARGALVSACGAPRGRSAPVSFGNAPCRTQSRRSILGIWDKAEKHMPFLRFTTFDPIAEGLATYLCIPCREDGGRLIDRLLGS